MSDNRPDRDGGVPAARTAANPAALPRPHRSPLTWLYVPADQATRIPKAFAAGADVVILDLEDAVAPTRKEAARAEAVAAATTAIEAGAACQVRVNAVGTPWHDADLDAVATLPDAVGLRLPKCETPAQVSATADKVGGARPIHLLVESARGLERAFDLATAHPEVASIGLGEADLRADLGVRSEEGLMWARSRIVTAAAAAGLDSPSMSVHPDVRDLDGLRASCVVGRHLGLVGRAAIHPAQLAVIRDVFTPSAEELGAAREIVEAAAAGSNLGIGAIALADGRFVDEAVVRQARRILRRAGGSAAPERA